MNVETALEYLNRGWSIIPIEAGGKLAHKELLQGSVGDSFFWKLYCEIKPDVETVQRWWTDCPDANIAVVTGAVSGVFVIDMDSEEGSESIFAMIPAGYGPIPTVKTERGLHLYFKWPGVKLSNADHPFGALGWDIRGDDGYAILPP